MKINKTISLSMEAINALKLLGRPASHVIDELIRKEAHSTIVGNSDDIITQLRKDDWKIGFVNPHIRFATWDHKNHYARVLFDKDSKKILYSHANSDHGSEIIKKYFPTLGDIDN